MRGETGFAEGEYILRPFVPGVTLTLDMFSSKSTFAGGETYLQIDSDTMERRFDEGTGETVGVYRIELEIPEDEDSYCFRYTVDQHSNHGTVITFPKANNGDPYKFSHTDPVLAVDGDKKLFIVNVLPIKAQTQPITVTLDSITKSEGRDGTDPELDDISFTFSTKLQTFMHICTSGTAAGYFDVTWVASDSSMSPATADQSITVVEVDYLQYKLIEKKDDQAGGNDGGQGGENAGEWIDVEDDKTIYVLKGQEVKFRAVPYPGEDSSGSGGVWPASKPVWSGSSGTTGTGVDEVSATFDTVSNSVDDYKTTIAECGNEKTAKTLVIVLDSLQVTGANEWGRPGSNVYTAAQSKGEFIDIEAIFTPSININELPENYIVWTNGQKGRNQANRKLSKDDPLSVLIEAKCETITKQVAFVIRKVSGPNERTEITGTPNIHRNAATSGITPSMDDVLEWHVTYDEKSDKWFVRVDSYRTTAEIKIRSHPSKPNEMVVPNTPNPVDGGNINNNPESTNYWKDVIDILKTYDTDGEQGGASLFWHDEAASMAHEMYHWNEDWIKACLKEAGDWISTEDELEGLSVPASNFLTAERASEELSRDVFTVASRFQIRAFRHNAPD